MRYTLLAVLAFTLLFAILQFTNGHGQFTNPKPRTFGKADALTQKTSPCGNVKKTRATQSYKAGQKVPITWNIQANHGGIMRIKIIDYAGGDTATLVDNIKSAGGDTTVNVTIPDRYCSNCTLQWMWIPANEAPYYGCVDINVDGKVVTQTSTNVGNNNNGNNKGNKSSAFRVADSSLMVIASCLFALLAIVFQF